MLIFRGPIRINESNSCLCAGHSKNLTTCLSALSKLTVHVLSQVVEERCWPHKGTVGQGFGSVYKSKRLFT